jgi:hypothetical protein
MRASPFRGSLFKVPGTFYNPDRSARGGDLSLSNEGAAMTNPPCEPGRRRLHFSLRILLLILAALAIPLGWQANRVWNQRIAVAEIQQLGGRIKYEHDSTATMNSLTAVKPRKSPGPKWLRTILGDDFFMVVTGVDLVDGVLTDDTLFRIGRLSKLKSLNLRIDGISDLGLSQIARLSELELLTIHARAVTDNGLKQLRHCKALKHLQLREAARITDAAIAHIAELKNLEFALIDADRLTDESLVHIAKLPNLQGISLHLPLLTGSGLDSLTRLKRLDDLCLYNGKMTDAGIKSIAKLNSLKKLRFIDIPITDAELGPLCEMRNLEVTEFQRTKVTGEGARRLQKALPTCFVIVHLSTQ